MELKGIEHYFAMLDKNGCFVRSEISIGSWNINGVWQRINSFRYNKLNNPDVINLKSNKSISSVVLNAKKIVLLITLHCPSKLIKQCSQNENTDMFH